MAAVHPKNFLGLVLIGWLLYDRSAHIVRYGTSLNLPDRLPWTFVTTRTNAIVSQLVPQG